MNRDHGWRELLDALAGAIEGQGNDAHCTILLLDERGTNLRLGAAPTFPKGLVAAIDGLAIGPCAAGCGTAAFRRERVVTPDIATEPLWADLRQPMLTEGLRAACSTPILSSASSVLGTLAIYYRTRHEPDARELRLIDSWTRLAAIALERMRAEEELRERLRRDSLTGTLNHGAITEALADLVSVDEDARHAVAMVDVDGMKATNDTYGRQLGDALLLSVVRELQRDDALVGRYGGDEFIVVLPGADRAEAERYRDAVVSSLAASGVFHQDTGARVPMSVSIGLAIYPDEAQRIEDLVKLADNAMYASRHRPVAWTGDDRYRPLTGERAAKLAADVLPLLTSPGSREHKLNLVAHQLSVGAGYDAVNFEVAGAPSEAAPPWQRAFAQAPDELLDAWMRELNDANEHPISRILDRTRRPLFLDKVEGDERLTAGEREVLLAAGLRSGLAVPMIWRNRMIGILSVGSKQEAAFTSWDAHFLTAVASQVTAIVFMTTLVEDLQEASAELTQSHSETVMMLASAAEAHDATTGRHLQRVRAMTEALALELGYAEQQAKDLGLASALHDIGKIRVPNRLLASADRLDDEAWKLMKQHTFWGQDFLGGRPGFELAAVIARSHHERWDGTGYPDGLAGEEIPEAAAIVGVADSCDAMTNDRPYRPGRRFSEALEEIVACSGRQFSPTVVKALVRLHNRRGLPLDLSSPGREAAA